MILMCTHLHYIDACPSLLPSYSQTILGYLFLDILLLHNTLNPKERDYNKKYSTYVDFAKFSSLASTSARYFSKAS